MINKTVFQLRYRLAGFLLANDIFERIINQPNFADLKGLSLLQHDKGFYLTSYRLVEQLVQIDTNTEEDAELFKQKVLDGKTLYFLKQPLERAGEANLREQLEAVKSTDDLIAVKLFDTLVFKAIYDTYFMAYEGPEYSYEFLDDSTAQLANSSIPVNAFGVFTAKTLALVESLFDFDDNVGVKKAIKLLKKNEHVSMFVQFLALAERHALVAPPVVATTHATV